MKRLRTGTRFETEAKGNSEIGNRLLNNECQAAVSIVLQWCGQPGVYESYWTPNCGHRWRWRKLTRRVWESLHLTARTISRSTLSWYNKLVSESCAVGVKSEQFWRVTGESNLADRREDCSTGQSAVVWVRKPNFGSFCCGQPFVFDCPVARKNMNYGV